MVGKIISMISIWRCRASSIIFMGHCEQWRIWLGPTVPGEPVLVLSSHLSLLPSLWVCSLFPDPQSTKCKINYCATSTGQLRHIQGWLQPFINQKPESSQASTRCSSPRLNFHGFTFRCFHKMSKADQNLTWCKRFIQYIKLRRLIFWFLYNLPDRGS